MILLTQNTTPIFKYIVWVLGKIMEGIFYVLDLVGIPNIGLSIIFFTIFVNVCMLPLTYKQQKFSKLSMKMQPEIKAIQKKYEGKKDQNSAMAQNNEIQAVYAKYGTVPRHLQVPRIRYQDRRHLPCPCRQDPFHRRR